MMDFDQLEFFPQPSQDINHNEEKLTGSPHVRKSEQVAKSVHTKNRAVEPEQSLSTKNSGAAKHADAITESDYDSEDEPQPKTVKELLLEIAAQGKYFHTPDKKAYVDLSINGARQTFPVNHKTYKLWLRQELYKRHGKAVGSETLNSVLAVLEAQACFDGKTREVYLRVATHKGKIYIDLGTETGEVIEVDSEGWRNVKEPPVRFRRPETQMPLPLPERGGQLFQLRQLLNLDDESWILTISWLLYCLYPDFPHPILILNGEQGSGKSYLARLLKALVDPGKAPLIPNIADLRNLAIAAINRCLLVYDNLSSLSADQSDALCRIATGAGFSNRTLHTNDEETVLEFIRSQILTGIDSLASRGDLMERSLVISLSTIPEDERKTEAALNQEFEQVQGKIFGALLTALSQTLKALPTVNPNHLPRMADFARFAIAAEPALGLPPGSFLAAYESNRAEAHKTIVESSPVAMAIQRLMESQDRWGGTPTELLDELSDLVDAKTLRSKYWCRSVRSLGKQITRLAPDLRGIGIVVTQERTSTQRLYSITKVNSKTS